MNFQVCQPSTQFVLLKLRKINGLIDSSGSGLQNTTAQIIQLMGFTPAIIPGGLIGSVGSIAFLENINDRDADQILSHSDLSETSNNRIVLNLSSIPEYNNTPGSDYIFVKLNNEIIGFGSTVADLGYIDLGPITDLTTQRGFIEPSEIRLGKAFQAPLEIVIAEPVWNETDSGLTPQIGTVFAQTSASDPVILDLENPPTLEELIGDGSPTDSPRAFAEIMVTAGLGPSIEEKGGVVFNDISTDTPSDIATNIGLIADTNADGSQTNFVGGNAPDILYLTTDINPGDSIDALEMG